MANQIEYFQHLVDTCEEPNNKWILQEQLEKEQRRVRKAKALRLLEQQAALEAAQPETQTVEQEEPKRRGRPSTKKED